MQNYRVWLPIVLLGSVLARAQAADKELLRKAAPKISEEDVKTMESALRHSTKA